jgi:cell wall-associated protease
VKVTFILICLFPFLVLSQTQKEWEHLDPEKDNMLGISTFRAYELLNGKKSNTVVVAIIDNGADLSHEDLLGQFWVNPGEIPGNGIDDDKNGYIDDIHGWNFLGNQKGENIKRENTELTRIYSKLRQKFGNLSDSLIRKKEVVGYNKYLKIKGLYDKSVLDKKSELLGYQILLSKCLIADSLVKDYFKSNSYTQLNLLQLKDTSLKIISSRDLLLDLFSYDLDVQKLSGMVKNCQNDLETRLNPDYNIRNEIIGDNPDDLNDSIYGNNMVDAQNPYHGTGMAGTIAALYNDIGINGVVKNVKLMILRVLPNGDENDKDVALAIKYAVSNKADIISCSFGKSYSMHPEFVEQAIKIAEKAGVLIVHAAGNDGRNNDSIPTYPTGYYSSGERASNWINVGASTSIDNQGIVAYFSNYGKKSVDVFAPGYEVPSCALGNKYDLSSGTSTAAPVVAGVAAVLKAYFPKLSDIEIKDIIIESAYIPKTTRVKLLGSGKDYSNFKDLSVSGGIVNLYNAIIVAQKKQ